MFLAITTILAAVFVVNVVLGAYGFSPFFGDIGEMLLLLAAVLSFVVVILRAESANRSQQK
ncbi:MAG: hypothetical protein NXI16_11580 [Alphaproteobacteria bacterium]|nr:hypothetical protein [Alphaproteobacteria bacterium]